MGAAHSRASRRGRRPRRPAEACAAANNSPCLPPRGKVAPQGRMRGRLPSPPIPGLPPAEGSRPLPTDRTIDGCSRHPPGRACPAPTVRRPGNGCPHKPRGRFHIPIRRAGCPHPAAASRCRQQQPLPSPLGEGGPAGPDEGQAPAAAHSRANRRGRRPRRQQQPLPSPLGEGGPAGPDEGQAPAAARSRANRSGRRPRRPGNLPPTPIPRTVTRGGVKTPPYGPNH